MRTMRYAMRQPFLCLVIALPWLTALPALAAPGPAESKSGESTKSLDPAKAFAGGVKEVPIDPEKEAPLGKVEPPVPPKQDPKPPGIPSGPSPALIVVGGVLAVAGIATGIGLTVAANGKGDD